MLLADLTSTAERVRSLSARGGKVQALAELLRQATPDEVPAVVAYLSGDLLQRQIGVGWAALRDLPPPAAEPSLTVDEVHEALDAIGARPAPGRRPSGGASSRTCSAARPTPSRPSSARCWSASCARARRRA